MRLKLTTALTLTLATLACGAQAADKPHRIVFIQSLTGNPFYDTVACGGSPQDGCHGALTGGWVCLLLPSTRKRDGAHGSAAAASECGSASVSSVG